MTAIDVNDLITKKEYTSLKFVNHTRREDISGYVVTDLDKYFAKPLQLAGHQIFINNLFNPHTPYKRIALNHHTGSGKTLVLNSTAKIYVEYFKNIREAPQVTVLTFMADTIVNELEKFPELGYISLEEKARMEQWSKSSNEADKVRKRYLQAIIRRRITDKNRGGFYKFYGYQQFSNLLFNITTKGLMANVSHSSIYENVDNFLEYIDSAIKAGHIEVNNTLLNSLKYGLVFCDEIHNVYNMVATNNRGLAIKYALDLLEREDPMSSPRVMYASATLLSGSPTEIISLMNLLIPLANYSKQEFFNGEDLLPGALEKISAICKGYISFVKNNISGSYPQRNIIGESFDDIPYLSFIKCKLSKLQQKTMETIEFPINSFIIDDMVFPNPKFSVSDIMSGNVQPMLYDNMSLKSTIASADSRWKNDIGIEVLDNTVSGSFLSIDRIGIFSSKYHQLLKDIIGTIKKGIVGKMLVYHPYLSGSGLYLLKEMMLQNGFLDEGSSPIASTMCSVCGVPNGEHTKASHKFMPCRLLMMHGEDKKSMNTNLRLFKSMSNVFGYEYRLVLGSKVVQEGVDFNALRFLYVASPTIDISSLMQLFGRAIRNGSHDQLDPQYRNVDIRVYVQVSPTLDPPDLTHYKKKIKAFIDIQKIESELRKYAVDSFINYDKMLKVKDNSIDGIPYEPAVTLKQQPKEVNFSWRAFGYADNEVFTIINIIKKLFILRPVWTFDDLCVNIMDPLASYASPYDHSTFDKSNIVIALNFLISEIYADIINDDMLVNNPYIPYIRTHGDLKRIVYADPYFVLVMVDQIMMPIVDFDSYIPHKQVDKYSIVPLGSDGTMTESNLEKILDKISKKYDNKNLYKVLTAYDENFHIAFLKADINDRLQHNNVTKQIVKLYDTMNYYIYVDNFIQPEMLQQYSIKRSTAGPIGYAYKHNAYIFGNGTWNEISLHLVRRPVFKENNIIIGFMDHLKDIVTLKLRPPLQLMKDVSDMRSFNRGTRCDTITQADKVAIIKNLNINADDEDMCKSILNELLKRELAERVKNGNIKWIYTIMETVPTKLNK